MLPFIADMPPLEQERVVCSIAASVKYQVPSNVILAVAQKEGGKPGQWVKNTNGTYDVGPMQFNTAYLKDLARYGIKAKHVAASGCYPYELAAWRIGMHIRRDEGEFWQRAANYHSKTYEHNKIYRTDLKQKAFKWGEWLIDHFGQVDFTEHGGITPSNEVLLARIMQKADEINNRHKIR